MVRAGRRRLILMALVGAMLLAGCGPDMRSRPETLPPAPPGAEVEPRCPKYAELGDWVAAHRAGSVPEDLTPDRVLWCSGSGGPETYVQRESSDPRAVDLLQMPSYREKNPRIVCPAIADPTLYIFVAVHGERAVHVAPPQGPCGVSDEFIVQLETVGWRP